MSVHEDTIAAIATPKGIGGIGIIRISGPDAETIGRCLFRSRTGVDAFRSRYLYYGDAISPETGLVLDEVLFSMMRAPHSYTGEDTVEINCHGGPAIMETILAAAVSAGARPADPGEFTKRAFLNNRIDLSQAEAVIELITARTDRGRTFAISQLKGTLSQKIRILRTSLIDILAHLETAIDFTDEDIEPIPFAVLATTIDTTMTDIAGILGTYTEGRIARDGVSVVIAGKPNVGKSSLLNTLLGVKRAIITPIPGTTRDFIEEVFYIKGLPVQIIDTAGVRNADDMIEEEGIRLVWEKASSADLILILVDGSTELTAEDFEVIRKSASHNCLVVVNKTDLPQKLTDTDLAHALPGAAPHRISAKYGTGIAELKDEIHMAVMAGRERNDQAEIVLTGLRHKTALEKAGRLLMEAQTSLREERSPELAALDVREALDSLGEIIGITTHDEVLDRIFAAFCIGK